MHHFILIAFCLIAAMPLSAEEKVLVWDEASELKDWERAIRSFRRDHNFTILAGRTSSTWRGKYDGQKYRFRSEGAEVALAYSFHIPWTQGVGYTLGTSMGVITSESSREGFSTHYRAQLPGVELGIVWNLSDRWRLGASAIYGWERIDQLRLSEDFLNKKLSLTGETLSYKLALDHFYLLAWAVRFEVEYSTLCYPAKGFCYRTSDKYELEKTSLHGRLGIVKHLL